MISRKRETIFTSKIHINNSSQPHYSHRVDQHCKIKHSCDWRMASYGCLVLHGGMTRSIRIDLHKLCYRFTEPAIYP